MQTRQQRRFAERHLNDVIRAATRGGDICQGCGRRLRSLESTLTGIDRSGRPRIVAQCCVAALDSVFAFGLYVSKDEKPERARAAAEKLCQTMGASEGRA
jgi:hypothetical protein